MGIGHGIRSLLEGISLAFSPGVRRFILLPALASLIIVVAGLVFALGYIEDFSNYLASFFPDFLSWLIDPILYLFGLLMGAWLFGFIATIVGSPFYGNLSARIDPIVEPDARPWVAQIWPIIKRELVKLRYVLPRLIGMFALGFIPVINIIAPFVWLTYGGWLMAVQFSDFRFENHGHEFADTLATLRPHRAACIGLGAGLTFAMSIPLLNFIVAPVAVVAATHFCRSLSNPSS